MTQPSALTALSLLSQLILHCYHSLHILSLTMRRRWGFYGEFLRRAAQQIFVSERLVKVGSIHGMTRKSLLPSASFPFDVWKEYHASLYNPFFYLLQDYAKLAAESVAVCIFPFDVFDDLHHPVENAATLFVTLKISPSNGSSITPIICKACTSWRRSKNGVEGGQNFKIWHDGSVCRVLSEDGRC